MLRVPLFGLLALLVACGGGDDNKPVGDTEPAVDTDGDGYTDDVDCAPEDPEIHPDAMDVPYDGVDADCEGDDDMDRDGDGFVGTIGGGDDCDDSNPTINPDATEVCYNLLDENCDGYSTDAADCDGDGYDMSHDCWDDPNTAPETFEGAEDGGYTAADVHPDGQDAWYDGWDTDCANDDDYDQDLDGESSAEHLDGGTDCDDTSAAVNTEADETWNDVDDDCDGTVDVLSSRDETGVWYGDNSIDETLFAWDFDTVSDLDGDGIRDVVVGVPGATKYSGRAYVLPWSDGLNVPATDTLATIEGDGAYLGWQVETLADGDGGELVAVGAPAGSEVYVYGADQLAGGASLSGSDAHANIGWDYTGWAMDGWRDDEGADNLIVASYADLKYVTEASFAVFAAGDLAAGGSFDLTSARWSYTTGAAPNDMAAVGDFDGDGLQEVGMGAVNSFGGIRAIFVTGAQILAGEEPSNDAFNEFSTTIRFGGTFDADGDGRDDLVVADPGADGTETGDGKVWFVLGDDALVADGAIDDAAFATLVGGEDGAAVVSARKHVDVDGDGELEFVGCAPGDGASSVRGACRLVPAATIAAGGQFTLGEATPSWTASNPNDQFGYDALFEDIDGDGDLDLWLSSVGDSGSLFSYRHD